MKRNKNKWRGVTISLRTGGQGHPTPSLFPTTFLTHTNNSNCSIINTRFSCFQLERDGLTDRRTDIASYRVACPQLTMNDFDSLLSIDHREGNNINDDRVNILFQSVTSHSEVTLARKWNSKRKWNFKSTSLWTNQFVRANTPEKLGSWPFHLKVCTK